jgi:Asp/Glu/hydantoin racemase
MPIRIGLVHALGDSIGPTDSAVKSEWPEADAAHLFDGSLYLDRSRGTASAEIVDARVGSLLHHSEGAGAKGILFTGSFFGAAVMATRPSLRVPALTSYEALIEEALAVGTRFAVLATAADSVRLLSADLKAAAGRPIEVIGVHVAGALEALTSGDRPTHDRMVVDAVAKAPKVDAILLGQFSMAPARAAAEAVAGSPLLTAPEAGIRKLRRLLS